MSKSCCNQDSQKNDLVDNVKNAHREVSFKVSGMDCADEVKAITNSLKIPGVVGVESNIVNESVTVFCSSHVDDNTIIDAINRSGVTVVIGEKNDIYRGHLKKIILVLSSGLLLAIGAILEWQKIDLKHASSFLFIVAIIFSFYVLFPKILQSIKSLSLDMNVLMIFAVIGALTLGEYSEAATVVFLFSLAELLEAFSVSKARNAIKSVMKIVPQVAYCTDEQGNIISKEISLIKTEELIVIRPGEIIPLDGLVVSGSSSVNEAPLTGESKLIEKNVNDHVLAGTINQAGALYVKVTKTFRDTKFSQIIALIENAQSTKAPSQRFVDRFTGYYTPAIFIFSILVAVIPPVFFGGIWNVWFYRSLVLLVIGCPCALVIATPISIVSGLASLAKRGVLVKGGIFLEALGKLKAVALDKTGTLTLGIPKVIEVKLFADITKNELLRLAASLEMLSTHPLALAIIKEASENNVQGQVPTHFIVKPGQAIEGDIDGHRYFLGNHRYAHDLGICGPELEGYLDSVEMQALSVVIIGHSPHSSCKGEVLGVFSIGDKIRPEAKDAIAILHKLNIKTVVLSGDNQKSVSSIALGLNIDEAHGSLLPDNKVFEIKSMVEKFKYVGMVGDGINDAPALAHATIGIAMGGVGANIAIESADVVLMKDNILELPKAIAHGKQVLKTIRFNIAFAIVIKVIFFILALFGLSNLWMAVVADMGASLFVIFNALRLLNIR